MNAESFGQIKGDSIDYAVMEKTSKGKVVKLNAGWDDVGSWSVLYDISKKDNIEPWQDDKGILYIGIEQFLLEEDWLR